MKMVIADRVNCLGLRGDVTDKIPGRQKRYTGIRDLEDRFLGGWILVTKVLPAAVVALPPVGP